MTNTQDLKKNWVTRRRGEAFMALGLETADWHYDGRTLHEENHCELCGTPIWWRYALTHGPTGKTLWVGCECIHWYYQAWFPNGLERAINLLKQQTKNIRERLIQERLDLFRLEEPMVVDYLLNPAKRSRWGRKLLCYLDTGIVKYIPFNNFRLSLLRKGYLKEKELEVFKSSFDKSLAGVTNVRAD
jgi:hypothetical protein